MSRALKTFNMLKGYPMGRRIFSFILCRMAPYFGTISPLFEVLEPGRCVILMKKRKAVTNHLKTVHAIAMCNLVELAGGTCTDVSVAEGVRWIPEGMTVEYIALAKTDLKGVCNIDIEKIRSSEPGKAFAVEVNVYDTSEKVVMRGSINMHLSLMKKHGL